MQVVLVGDPAAVRAPVSALEVGELAVYDAEGHPIG
jgi:hypothetical protein